MKNLVDSHAGKTDTRVGKGENRKDDKGHCSMEIVLHALERGVIFPHLGLHGDEHGQENTCERGMDPGLEHGDPHDCTDDDIDAF